MFESNSESPCASLIPLPDLGEVLWAVAWEDQAHSHLKEAAQSLSGATSSHSHEWSSVGLSDVNVSAWNRCLSVLVAKHLQTHPSPTCHSVPWLRSENRNNWKWCLPFLGAWHGPIGFPRCLQHCSITAVCTRHSHPPGQSASPGSPKPQSALTCSVARIGPHAQLLPCSHYETFRPRLPPIFLDQPRWAFICKSW